MIRTVNRILTFLEIALLIGAYVVNYFTPRKMGMFRFVGYKNVMWEQQYNIESLKNISFTVLIIMAVAVIVFTVVKLKSSKNYIIIRNVVVTVVLTLSFAFFVITNSTETYKAYYFISILTGFAVLFQILKNLLNVILIKSEK